MHVILKDQTTPGEESIMCVERDATTAIILKGDFDQLDQLVSIATSMKVPKVYLIVDRASIGVFAIEGWVESEKILMEKKASKTK